jgi:hypothetical protein
MLFSVLSNVTSRLNSLVNFLEGSDREAPGPMNPDSSLVRLL